RVQGRRPGVRHGRGGRLGPHERGDLVPAVAQLPQHGRPDEPGPTGEQHLHVVPPVSFGGRLSAERHGIRQVLVTSPCHTSRMDTMARSRGRRGGDDVSPGGPDVFSVDCPSRLVVERIGDKWTLLVFMALRRRVLRFGELRDLVGAVTPKVLTQTLRSLERDGLVTRTVYAEVPPRVEYALTDLGRSLLGPIDAIRAWSEENGERIAASRAAAAARVGA